jgi:NAD(P)-dependent dehydrogenase (short-subunit alcohol dehydrogenase family)
MSDFTGKIAFITGGGQGLGAASAFAIASRGAKVILADINLNTAKAKAEEFVAQGFQADAVQLDVSDRTACNRVADDVRARHGAISFLVNNAGIVEFARMDEPESPAQWDRQIGINLTGGFNVATAFLPDLKANQGVVVNISSVAGFTSGFAQAGYTASKGGVRSLTKIMCRELAQHGMRINAVAPGYVATEGMGGKGNAAMEEWIGFHCPMKRHGRPEEVGNVVAFLCSDEASFINGATIPVDGGYLSV